MTTYLGRNGFTITLAGIAIATILAWGLLVGTRPAAVPLSPAQLAAEVRAGQIERLVAEPDGRAITVYYGRRDEAGRRVNLPANLSIFDVLGAYGVNPATTPVRIEVRPAAAWQGWLNLPSVGMGGLLGFGAALGLTRLRTRSR